jgi:protein-disulfide isomerase
MLEWERYRKRRVQCGLDEGMAMRKASILIGLIILLTASITCAPPPDCPDNATADPADELVLAVGTPAVTVVEYSDFQCPFCGQFARDTFPTIRAQYVDTGKVRWIFRHFPLRMHPNARKAAEAAQCSNNQGRFWEYHDVLCQHQGALAVDQLKSYASDLSLDRSLFDACLDGGSEACKIQSDLNQGKQDGVSGTPTFVINGQRFSGFRTVQQMSDLLNNFISAGGQ